MPIRVGIRNRHLPALLAALDGTRLSRTTACTVSLKRGISSGSSCAIPNHLACKFAQAALWTFKMEIKEFVGTYGVPHLGANIRRYKWLSWEGKEKEGAFGQFVGIKPTEGKFIHSDGNLSLFKTGASEFLVVATNLITDTFALGDKVRLEFYNLLGFDGLAADGSDDPAEVSGGIRSTTFMLTGGTVHIPVKWEGRYVHRRPSIYANWPTIQNPYLIDMVGQLEGLKVSGYRNLVSVLVDANGTIPTFVDPAEDKSCDEDKNKWPSISTTLNSAKFKGVFTLRYDRALDTYEIVLAHQDGTTDVLENVHVMDLSTIVADRIDDGTWKDVKTTLLKAAPKKKAVAA